MVGVGGVVVLLVLVLLLLLLGLLRRLEERRWVQDRSFWRRGFFWSLPF